MSEPNFATRQRIEATLLASGALQRGHVVMRDGQHSDTYIDASMIFQDRPAAMEIAQLLVVQIKSLLDSLGSDIDLVVSASEAIVPIATEIGRLIGVPTAVAGETPSASNIAPRARALLVDDVLTTGTTLQTVLPELYAAGAHPIAAAVVVRRTPLLTAIEAEGRDPIPLIAGITLNLPTYDPADCPFCLAGEPIRASGRG